MTRINDHLLVQRSDDHIVLVDESHGGEVAFHVDHVPAVLAALTYLWDGGADVSPPPIPVLDVNAADPEAEAARYAAAVEEWHNHLQGDTP